MSQIQALGNFLQAFPSLEPTANPPFYTCKGRTDAVSMDKLQSSVSMIIFADMNFKPVQALRPAVRRCGPHFDTLDAVLAYVESDESRNGHLRASDVYFAVIV